MDGNPPIEDGRQQHDAAQGALPGIWRFGPFQLDGTRRILTAGGVPVALRARTFDLLRFFVTRHGETLSADEISWHVWRGVNVGKNNLGVQLSALRKVLGAHGGDGLIVTLPGRGYCFVGEVEYDDDGSPTVEQERGELPFGRLTRWRPSGWLALAALLIIAIAGGAWFLSRPAAGPAPFSPQDRRMTVAVLPFENLSGDPALDLVAKQMTNDMVEEFSELSGVSVLPATASAPYANLRADPPTIGRLLKVHFIVEGEVNRSGADIVLTGWTIDARTGMVLGRRAEPPTHYVTTYQKRKPERELFRYFGGLQLEVEVADAKASGRRLDWRDLANIAILAQYAEDQATFDEGMKFAEEAYAAAPSNELTMEVLARARGDLRFRGCHWLGGSNPAEDQRTADLFDEAFDWQPTSMAVMQARARFLLLADRRADAHIAFQNLEQTIPGNEPALYGFAQLALREGDPDAAEKAVMTLKQSAEWLEAEPLEAELSFIRGDYEKAIEEAHRAGGNSGSYEDRFAGFLAASAEALTGEIAAARSDAARAGRGSDTCRIATLPRGYFDLSDTAWLEFKRGLALAGVMP